MKILLRLGVFFLFFLFLLVWRFPYDAGVERGIRQIERSTGSVIGYTPRSANILGVKVVDLTILTKSGAKLTFDSAHFSPSWRGVEATALQGDNPMEVSSNGRDLQLDLQKIKVDTGNDIVGKTEVTGTLAYNVRTKEGKGDLRLVIPELGVPLPVGDGPVELGSTFVISNIGTLEKPRSGVSTDLKLVSSDGNSSANGRLSLESQVGAAPQINGTIRYAAGSRRGSVRLTGPWNNPSFKINPE